MNQFTLFILLSLIAEIIGTICGFGSSVLFVPIAGFFLDFKSVLGITAIFHLSSNLSKIGLFRKNIDKRIFLWIGIPSIVFVLIGAWLSKYVDEIVLNILLASFLIIFSLFNILFKYFKIHSSLKNSLIGGSISGFLAGIVGTGGAVRGATLLTFNLGKNTFIATSALIDFVVDLSRTILYFFNGYVHKHDLVYVPFLLIIGILGTYIGKKFLEHVSEENFRKIVLYSIFLIGIIILIKVCIKT